MLSKGCFQNQDASETREREREIEDRESSHEREKNKHELYSQHVKEK